MREEKKGVCQRNRKEPSSGGDEGNPEMVWNDSSEYSNEVDSTGSEASGQPYLFAETEADVGDFILVGLELEEG